LEIVGLYSNAVALDRTMMFSTPSESTMLDTKEFVVDKKAVEQWRKDTPTDVRPLCGHRRGHFFDPIDDAASRYPACHTARVDDWVDERSWRTFSDRLESSSQAFCVAVVSSLPSPVKVLHPAQAQSPFAWGERCFQMISIQNSDKGARQTRFSSAIAPPRACLPMEERLLRVFPKNREIFSGFHILKLEDEEMPPVPIRPSR